MHVRLALGDFGSRTSSLTQLVQLPIQLVKLDRSIVAGLPDARELAVVRAVVAVAKSLSIPVLAGGIETDEQASVLHREGVALMQGSLFGRPQTAAELVPTSRARADDAQTRLHQGEG